MKLKILLCLAALCASTILANAADAPSRDDARKLFTDQPRKVETVRKAATALSAVAKANEKDYDDQWHAARAWCWLADYGANDDEKKKAAQQGIDFGKRAKDLDGKRVEGHYFHARSLLMMADILHGPSSLGFLKDAKKSLDSAIECDEKFEEGGPHRLLGLLQLGAPTFFSVGDRKEADKHIRRAVELAPDFPENQVALAKLLHFHKDDDGARVALKKALDAPPWPSKLDEDKGWKESINKYLKNDWK